MSDTSDVFPAFTLPQLGILTAWSAAMPRGFQVRLVTDDYCAEEISEFVEGDECEYTINPTTDGGVALISTDWHYCRKLDAVEVALAALLAREETWRRRSLSGFGVVGSGLGSVSARPLILR